MVFQRYDWFPPAYMVNFKLFQSVVAHIEVPGAGTKDASNGLGSPFNTKYPDNSAGYLETALTLPDGRFAILVYNVSAEVQWSTSSQGWVSFTLPQIELVRC